MSDLPILGPDADPAAEDDELGADDRPIILITGAAGNLGRKLSAAWHERYALIRIDHRVDPDDPDLFLADLASWDDSWAELFDEADAVVHLAAAPRPDASWEDLYRPNVDATANVLLAAAQAGVERLVFASSSQVMGGYRQAPDGAPISPDLEPRPLNPYGASKLVGERLGASFAAAYAMTVVALRLGWIQDGENRPETLPDDWARSLWMSNYDMVRLFTCALEAELEPGRYVVVNGTSNNRGSRWTLAEAAEALGFHPQDGIA